jgi:hypothetical protein
MDNYIETDQTEETNVDITPNIKYQINKFGCVSGFGTCSDNNIFTNKIIPLEYFFISSNVKLKILSIFQANCDIPMMIHGNKGSGKLTAIIGLLREIPQYGADVENDADRMNNIVFMKILNKEYEKLFSYEIWKY